MQVFCKFNVFVHIRVWASRAQVAGTRVRLMCAAEREINGETDEKCQIHLNICVCAKARAILGHS